MIDIAPGVAFLDLQFQGRARVIATGVLRGAGEIALVDPGPSSSLASLTGTLEQHGIGVDDLTAILLTHIHLDHAGATGSLVRRNPRLRVYVHERGAPHMANPEKLLASARRLWGDELDRLWGECVPVPADAMTILSGGETLQVAGQTLDVAWTPGHASHHVSYFLKRDRIALVGDTAGIKVVPNGDVLPPTPPPDIDLEAWRASLELIESRNPSGLFLTHFGWVSPVGDHFSVLRERLETAGRLALDSLGREGTDEEREAWFTDQFEALLRRSVSAGDTPAYEAAGQFNLNWRGLARYWRKKPV
jgi:glyoxylase-like metal-dependent hydrolase (beta-lactamase superfamily II)